MGRPTPQGLGHGSLPTTALPFSHILLCSRLTPGSAWFHCLGFPLLSLPGSPFGTVGGTMVIPQGVYASVLLFPLTSPALILRLAFYPLEEGGTNLCNMVLHPIVWNLGSPVWECIALPKTCERSRLRRALLPKGSTTSLQKAFTTGARWSLYLSSYTEGHVLQCAGILQDHVLLGA